MEYYKTICPTQISRRTNVSLSLSLLNAESLGGFVKYMMTDMIFVYLQKAFDTIDPKKGFLKR